MPLPLDKTLKRELTIDGARFTVTISPYGVKLVRTGFRKGRLVSWRALAAGIVPDAPGDAPGDARGDAAAAPPLSDEPDVDED